MLPAVSDRRDLDGEPASKRGVAGVRTHERYKKKKSLINSSRQSSNRNHTAVDLESWSMLHLLSLWVVCAIWWGEQLCFQRSYRILFFFFKCRRSPPSSGNSYMCQDGRVDSQSTREHTQSESWWDRPTRRSRGKLIVSQRFPSWSQHSQRRSSLEIASPLSKTQPDIQN